MKQKSKTPTVAAPAAPPVDARRRHDPQKIAEIVQRYRDRSGTGETVRSIAERFGVGTAQIYAWVRKNPGEEGVQTEGTEKPVAEQTAKAGVGVSATRTPTEQRIALLEAENRELRQLLKRLL